LIVPLPNYPKEVATQYISVTADLMQKKYNVYIPTSLSFPKDMRWHSKEATWLDVTRRVQTIMEK
jgi:glycyl-tRNA synthetase beta subunit